ncbi:hypothetical protein EW146_g2513 [Bondarzewia mesenterica]|uniref:Rab-GAP TBC domain-containing protein n=1 Tax=Bondarzewia mesenterica TaxID=1095465 RepID=A0A4S4M6K2_9AGAM|nr:hypothetical protein EW146_g2513 [Bondarzewia mesenterica]
MLPVLILIKFRIWLDSARLLFLLMCHIGLAMMFALWLPNFQCPNNTSDDQGICQLLNTYVMIASWVPSALLLAYGSCLAVYAFRYGSSYHVVDIIDSGSNDEEAAKLSGRRDTLPMILPDDGPGVAITAESPHGSAVERTNDESAFSHRPSHASQANTLATTTLTMKDGQQSDSKELIKKSRHTSGRLSKRLPLWTMSGWDIIRVKAQFRLAAHRLGQLRDRKDAQGQLVGRDISILLQQGNTTLARAKAQKLIQDEISGDLLEVLEMQIGVLLERSNELDNSLPPSPAVVEAASSIIFAAPQTESKDLQAVRDILAHRLGADFTHSAITNRDNYVSPQVVRALSAPPASAADLDNYLMGIARSYGVPWAPNLRPDDVLDALSEILDKSDSAPVVDMPRLRRVCAHGIPSSPSWLRPRTWSLPPPTEPLAPLDASLTDAIKDLFRVPPNLFSGLEEEPEASTLCPLDDTAPDDIKIDCADNLDIRLKAIYSRDSENLSQGIPEIRLESDAGAIPGISLNSPDSASNSNFSAPTTLLPSKVFNTGAAHPKHASALIRLLYVHSCLNPANHSPHMASLLIPLYSVLTQEVEPQELAHAEADTFWLFEAMVGEFAELEDEEGGNEWMKKFGERLAWADPDLLADLHAKGLDPSLPHYSYRWLAPILTHTLPLPSVLCIWDALFSQPMTTRHACPKLDYLLDVCTSMLLRAKGPIYRLGKSGRRSPGLWNDENSSTPPPSPVRAWELNDAFVEGMALLQLYSIEAAGGVESILQTAAELAHRREEMTKAPAVTNTSLGSRLRDTMWRGFTNQLSPAASSPDSSDTDEEESHDDGNETETPSMDPANSSGLTSRLANVVWKGITNQSAMEPPASPISPLSPLRSRSPSPAPPQSPHPQPAATLAPPSPSTSLWGYAEKLKDSDTAATLAKVSTNWRVKAMQAWSNRGNSSQLAGPSPLLQSAAKPRSGSFSLGNSLKVEDEDRRSSLPGPDRSDVYSPPARPAFFRPPRDSWLPQPRRSPLSSPTSPDSQSSVEDGASTRAKSIRMSLASLTGMQTTPSKPEPKKGPRPLLLSSSSLITGSSTPSYPRLPSTVPRTHQREWSDVLRNKPHLMHKTSQSSISSMSDMSGRSRRNDIRSDFESDTAESRIIPIHRKSVSPMAPAFRTSREGQTSVSSSSDRGALSPSTGVERIESHSLSATRDRQDDSAQKGWGRMDVPDSPVTLPSSPPPPTPPSSRYSNGVEVSGAESQRGSMVLTESNVRVLEPPAQARKVVRKKTPPPSVQADDTSDSSFTAYVPPRSPRVRSKRIPARPANLSIQRSDSGIHAHDPSTSDLKTPSPNNLAPPEWPDDNAMTPRATKFDAARDSDADHRSSSASPTSSRSPKRIRKASTDGNSEVRARKISTEGRTRKISTDGHEGRPRKISTDGHSTRTRKMSTESREPRRATESAAEEGDDEGYDELLSAYESEDNAGGLRR